MPAKEEEMYLPKFDFIAKPKWPSLKNKTKPKTLSIPLFF